MEPGTAPREPAPITVVVRYKLPDSFEQIEVEMLFDNTYGQWELDVSDIPPGAIEARLKPFMAPSVCGDTFTLTQDVIFTSELNGEWPASCPIDS